MNDWDYYPELEKIPPGMPEPPVTPQGNAGADGAAQEAINCGEVPERETFWLLERHDGKAWASYTSQIGSFVHTYTEDVWQAGRFKNERECHDRWRMLVADERTRWKPVEHMFINKVQDTSPLPSAQCNCHPYIADTYGHDLSCSMSSHHRTTEGEQS